MIIMERIFLLFTTLMLIVITTLAARHADDMNDN